MEVCRSDSVSSAVPQSVGGEPRRLISLWTDENLPSEGRTPLAVVAAVGSAEAVEIAKMLLDRNAEPNSSDKARGAVIV